MRFQSAMWHVLRDEGRIVGVLRDLVIRAIDADAFDLRVVGDEPCECLCDGEEQQGADRATPCATPEWSGNFGPRVPFMLSCRVGG